jgi:hypothetical protein
MTDRRRHPRAIVNASGRLIVGDRVIINCVVQNICAGGACLEFRETFVIPDDFDLVLSRAAYTCHAVWRRYHSIGVSFLASEVN